ncbi:MAG: hypothetical protein HS126_10535 [Anaerolineales bacterium]|nr:hypothetical protein [Anaerolineales bacterium]
MSETLSKFVRVFLLAAVISIMTLADTGISIAQTGDPIPGYLSQISSANLVAVATDLVNLYGPRREDTFSPYPDDNCTVSSSVVYPKSTIEMSADYVKGLLKPYGLFASIHHHGGIAGRCRAQCVCYQGGQHLSQRLH